MRRTQRGLSESVQWAVLAPALLLVVLGLVHGGIWLHGRTVAAQAALAGAEAQAVAGAGSGIAEGIASQVAAEGGLKDIQVSSGRSGDEVVVEVRGRVDSFIPSGLTQVQSRAWMPAEEP
ncbi:TadE/TadG family type IV pilus assembly protein [Luteococcus peritonei]|uniref:TadE/TadG family type IV pilus assembly protein n=1 Tax=Luteococcus peritonei TaxID=88874 RepID=A0ABW4RUL4_9ACTN